MPNSGRPDVMTNDTAAIATLNIRTTSLEGRVNELTSTVNGVQTALSAKIDSLAQSLTSKIDERGRPQWAIYIAGAMAVFSVYAYMDTAKIGPLKEKDQDFAAILKDISSTIRSDMVPEKIHSRMWQQSDAKFEALQTSIEDRVRRVDETARQDRLAITERVKRVEEQFGNAYNLRDAIQQLDSRVRHFEGMTMNGRKDAPSP